jgi:hypothetical protein
MANVDLARALARELLESEIVLSELGFALVAPAPLIRVRQPL